VNLEMQPGRSRSVQWFRGERLETAQKYRIETVFLFVVNKLGFFAFLHLFRMEMAPPGVLIGGARRGAGPNRDKNEQLTWVADICFQRVALVFDHVSLAIESERPRGLLQRVQRYPLRP
jgi:hypothetical protein